MPRGIPNRAPEDQAQESALAEIDDLSTQPKYRLKIHRTNAKGESPRVSVGVNGHVFSIQRGAEVIVPEAVVRALEDAVELRYEPLEDGSLGPAQPAQSYPFQAVPV